MDDLRAEVQRISEELEALKGTSALAIDRINNFDKTLEYPPTEKDALVVKTIVGETGGNYIWGDIASSGSVYTISSGVSISRTGTGLYTVTHSINKTICIIIPNVPPNEGHLWSAYVQSYNDNVIYIDMRKSGVSTDASFYFIAFPQN